MVKLSEGKISKFFTSAIPAFIFLYFMEKAPSLWGKKGKKFLDAIIV